MPKSSKSHLSLDDRIQIQKYISDNKSFREIGRIINCSASTISREVKQHRIIKKANTFNNPYHSIPCSKSRINTFPWVCQGCSSYNRCRKLKYVYYADIAHKSYLNTLSETRNKLLPSSDAIGYLNKLLTPLIKDKSQSIDHVYASHSEKIGISKSTLYRYIDKGYLTIKNVDLPRRVRYKANRTKKIKEVKSTTVRVNRTYLDFLAFVDQYPNYNIVEIDSVVGKKGEGEKVILTIIFRKSNFMLAFLRDKNDAQSVIDIFDSLEKKLGRSRFKSIFYITLGDNGSEFKSVDELEANSRKQKRCNFFYCDARSSQQKGKIEKNHEYFRKYFPQGQSLNSLTQSKLDEIMNHINSTKRVSLNNKSPFECLSDSQAISIKKLGYKEVPPDRVISNPSLLK